MANLSKIKIGDVVYDLKDAQARADLTTLIGSHALAALGAAAWLGADAEVTAGATGVATTAAVKSYVDAQVGAIHNFDVRVYTTLPTASADTMYILALVADSHATGDVYDEFITVRSGSDPSYTYVWEKIGNTDIDLSDYVQKTTTIAGVDLQDNITQAELQDALNLGNMAYANTASGSTTLATADSAAFANGAVNASATYTPAGSVNVTLKDATTATAASLTKADYTPAGNVAITPTTTTVKVVDGEGSVTTGTAASLGTGFYTAGEDALFSEGAFTPNVPTTIDVTKFNGGSKAADTFTQGTLPSLGAATTGSFATGGITASVDTTDTEMLVFTAATTATAVTAQGTFSAGSLPTFNEGGFTPASLGSGFYTEGSAASKAADTFTGGKTAKIDTTKFNGGTPTAVTLPTFDNATVMTGATAAFTGTEVKNFQVTGVDYLNQEVDTHTFTGTEATISSTGTATGTVNLTKTNKDISITVSPDAKE